MNPQEFIYELVLYNRGVKRLATQILKSPALNTNLLYLFYYNRLVKAKMQKFSGLPFRVMLENTNICDSDCVFCPHKKMKRSTGIMDISLSNKITDECARLKINYLTIYGFGEPLLDPHFFSRLDYAKSKGISRVTTNTNAMYLSAENIKRILECGLDEIYISIDASTEETYKKIRPGLSFRSVEQNIINLIREKKKRGLDKPKIMLSFVENSINEKEAPGYIRKWKGKVDGISVSIIHNWTGEMANYSCNNGAKRDPCRLLWTDMVISYNGDVPLCCNDYENRIILGNIKKESIPEIWGSQELRRIRQLHSGNDFDKISLCRGCGYNYHFKSPWWVCK